MCLKPYRYGMFVFSLICFLAGQNLSAQNVRKPGNRELTVENANTGKRLALVIGNGAYQNAPPLSNPTNDAADITTALRGLGFEVLSGTNQTLPQMRKLVRDFGAKLKQNGGVGLFYYAGHGIQVSGRNFLVPVEAEIASEVETEDVAFDINSVLRQMDAAGNGFNIVILDACRNNPFARSWNRDINSGGLAQISAPTGTLIAYATSPDSTASDGAGRNGLYTSALLTYIKRPNIDLLRMFQSVRTEVKQKSNGRQVPWESNSTVGEFYFAGSANTANNNPANRPGVNLPDISTVEAEYWERVKNSSNKADFDDYLKEYPNGRYAPLARQRVNELTRQTNTSKTENPSQKDSNPVNTQPAATVTYNELERDYKSGLYDEAIRKTRIFLQTEPANGKAQAYLGFALLMKKDIENGVAHLEKSIELGETLFVPLKTVRIRGLMNTYFVSNGEVRIASKTLTIKEGEKTFDTQLSLLKTMRLDNFQNQCPVVFLEGQFTESREKSEKKKQEAKTFHLFPPSTTQQQTTQNNIVTNLIICQDEGILTTAIAKLLSRLMAK